MIVQTDILLSLYLVSWIISQINYNVITVKFLIHRPTFIITTAHPTYRKNIVLLRPTVQFKWNSPSYNRFTQTP